jgi:hypothetical protein
MTRPEWSIESMDESRRWSNAHEGVRCGVRGMRNHIQGKSEA